MEDCVNRVGVDLNTASASLLEYVSGVSKTIAKNIVVYREENGKFASRSQLLKVAKLGPKAYEQCAGFMRISDGKNPLDATGVHPESYAATKQLLETLGYTLSDVTDRNVAGIDLLVINKSAGMPIHPSRNNPDNSLGNALAWYFKEQNKPFVFRCINRLDRDTSGLTIVAKHAVSAAILGQMVREKSTHGLEAQGIHREYLAIVEGNMTVDAGVISAPIARKEDRS